MPKKQKSMLGEFQRDWNRVCSLAFNPFNHAIIPLQLALLWLGIIWVLEFVSPATCPEYALGK